MFCVNCGKEVKKQAEFCPFCGKKMAAVSLRQPGNVEMTGGQSGRTGYREKAAQHPAGNQIAVKASSLSDENKKKILFGAVGVLVVVMLVILVVSLLPDQREYSIVGQWECDELDELDEIIGEVLGQNGVDAIAIEFVQGMLQKGTENFYATFTDSGKIYLSFYGLSTSSLGSLSWEQLDDKRIILDYTLDIPVINLPINVSFTTKYELKKNSLTLKIYNYELHFTRVE